MSKLRNQFFVVESKLYYFDFNMTYFKHDISIKKELIVLSLNEIHFLLIRIETRQTIKHYYIIAWFYSLSILLDESVYIGRIIILADFSDLHVFPNGTKLILCYYSGSLFGTPHSNWY